MKKTIKNLVVLALTVCLVLGSLTACGSSSENKTTDPTPTTAASSSTDSTSTNNTPSSSTEPTAAPVVVIDTAIEDKNVSAGAESLLDTVQGTFGGKIYLTILNNAYEKMTTGIYAAGIDVPVATVGDKNASGVTLNLSVLYNKLRMSYTLDTAYAAADGVTYEKGDLLPTWKQLQEDIGFTINDVTTTESSVNNNYKLVKSDNFAGIDVLCASAVNANEDGQVGSFIQLDKYFDYMPNLKAFLDENEVVKTTITAGDGHVYYAPYFDGYNDIEKTFLARIDWIKALLDGDYVEADYDTAAYTGSMTYTHYMPESTTDTNAIEVNVVKADGSGVETVTKSYEKNITLILSELATKNGATFVKALRDYIDTTYVNADGTPYYGTTRSDLFCGQNAAWDADEFVALLRCVIANPKYLTGGDVVYGIFGREATLQRNADLFTMACNLFGVRGADAEKDWLYFDAAGNLCDARQQPEMYYAIEKFNQMYADGLILADFDKEGAGGASGTKVYDTMYNSNLGFALYDYVQTQTAYNNTVAVEGFDLESLINPVAYWFTSTNDKGEITGTYTRFTESWRSVKTEGWVITSECAQDPDKLAKALALVDYMYSTEGNTLMSYGPYDWIEHDASGNIVTIDYQGQQVPKLSEAALTELKELASGNYTNYYRQYLGATFPIGYVKQQGMEYQCTAENGKLGLERINNALIHGVIEHVVVNTADAKSPFYKIIPTTFATTTSENAVLNETCINLTDYFSKTKGQYNIFIDAIKYGFETAINNKNTAAAE